MLIKVNKNNVVVASVNVGSLEGGFEVNELPEDFACGKYMYVDGRFEVNDDYFTVFLKDTKEQKINESKVKLAEWLENHPMQYTDGRFYSVTEEKQALLNSNLASYERAQDAGFPYPMKWNAKGEECEEWDYPDLVALSLTIAGYVAPKVAAQQAVEIEINACTTMEELAEVVIDYDNA